ncbi:MAG: MBL fold metallo-hydrolase [Dehalococcoidia bacterium]
MQLSYQHGISCGASGLRLDPTRAAVEAIVSHAHSDHVRRHQLTHATPATSELISLRYGYKEPTVAHEFRRPFTLGTARITLYPAGHILGSAQILVEEGDSRLLYSGDLRLRPSVASEETEVPTADVLIVDSTFGQSRYCFPPEADVVAGIVDFCHAAFAQDEVPVLYAYSLGKAQEAVMLLSKHGIPAVVHPAALKLFAAYRRHGVPLPDCEALSGRPPSGTAVIYPPQMRPGGALDAIGQSRRALLSGWAMDSGARYRYGCDQVFPLSDHCGFDDLLRYVELTGARAVYTLFGFAREFAAALQLRGVAAYALGQPTQLALPGLA